MKICPCCKQEKSLSNFGKDRRCKQCCNDKSKKYRRENASSVKESVKRSRKANPESISRSLRKARLKRFGLTEDDYDVLLLKQLGVCAVCKLVDSKALAVDHCHKTGKIRGLLCSACNKAEGLLRSDPTVIKALAQYVESNEGM